MSTTSTNLSNSPELQSREGGIIVKVTEDKLVIVTGYDIVVHMKHINEKEPFMVGKSVSFRESTTQNQSMRLVDSVKELKKDLAETIVDGSSVIINSPVKHVSLKLVKGKRQVTTAFFKNELENDSAIDFPANRLAASILSKKFVNGKLVKSTFVVKDEKRTLTGIVYKRDERTNKLKIFVPGFPEDFLLEESRHVVFNNFFGKWIEFMPNEYFCFVKNRTVPVFTENHLETASSKDGISILCKCFYNNGLKTKYMHKVEDSSSYSIEMYLENKQLDKEEFVWIDFTSNPLHPNSANFKLSTLNREVVGSGKEKKDIECEKTSRPQSENAARPVSADPKSTSPVNSIGDEEDEVVYLRRMLKYKEEENERLKKELEAMKDHKKQMELEKTIMDRQRKTLSEEASKVSQLQEDCKAWIVKNKESEKKYSELSEQYQRVLQRSMKQDEKCRELERLESQIRDGYTNHYFGFTLYELNESLEKEISSTLRRLAFIENNTTQQNQSNPQPHFIQMNAQRTNQMSSMNHPNAVNQMGQQQRSWNTMNNRPGQNANIGPTNVPNHMSPMARGQFF